ncbi:hypothetical protein ABH942_002848 [Flavobacterium sp. 28YEA47A]|uniref:hypothetical protein n=1 Tax=Flavobacterium sp. 28YEA47A TaxID=3156276 RepID=UPI0035185655
MRATEYGLLHYGNYSFTDIKSNIYAFNNEINIVNDETNENESNAYTEIIYVEIEPTDGNPNEFKLAEDGEILDYREGNYILNSNVIPAMEVSDSSTVFLQNLSIQARICKFGEKYFALVTKNIAGAVAWETFLGGLEIVATQMKKKKREKITLLNDILREKQLSVVLFISKDGALLETAYQSIDNLYENEIVLFIETNDSMNLFGSVIRIKTGANVSSSSGVPYKKLSKIVDYFNTNVSSSALQEIIKQHIADKSSGFFIVKRAFWGAVNRVVRFSSDLTLEGIGKISNGIGGLVGKLKLDDSKWQYYDDNGQPLKNASLFLPALGVIKYLQEANKKSKPEETNANAINKIIELEDILKESKKTLGKADFFKKIINQLLYMLRKVKDFLRDPLGKALDFTETAFVIYNAFVVGIINSIVDAIKGIFDIISILCNALAALQKKGRDIGQNPLSYLRLFFEIIENMVETLENLFSKENLKALIEFFKKSAAFILTLPTRAFAWLAENAAMPNLDKVAYYIGYIIGFIIQLILEILFTGGAKTAADAFKKLADSLINIFKTMEKIVFKFSDELVIGFENLLAIFAYIREKSKNLGVLLEYLFKWLNELFAGVKSKVVLSNGLTYSFIDPITIFTKFFYNLARKKWWGQLHELGISIAKNEEGLYTLIYKNEEIATSLDKTEIERYLKELFSNTQKTINETKSYLDDWADSKKLDDFINSKKFKFRELGYRFTHTLKKGKDGLIDISMFLTDKKGDKFWQGYSTISNGFLENVFDVTIQKQDISTAMYNFLDKIGFNNVRGSYSGNGSLNVNYDEFMKVYKATNNKEIAAFATPAGKALNKALDNKFKPDINNIIIREDIKKVIINWIRK